MKNNSIREEIEYETASKIKYTDVLNTQLKELNLELKELENNIDKITTKIYGKSVDMNKKIMKMLCIIQFIAIITTLIIQALNGRVYVIDKIIMSGVAVCISIILAEIISIKWRKIKIQNSKELQVLKEEMEQKKLKIKTLNEEKEKILEELAEITKLCIEKDNEMVKECIQNNINEVKEDIIEVGVEKQTKPYTRIKKKDKN